MPVKFNEKVRDDWIKKEKKFDVAIIGGGIMGAGMANLLSQNGISTVLFEKNDFASGTSSGSTKLVHGGIRYLENFQFQEVLDLIRERDYLTENTEIVKKMEFEILLDKYSWKKSTIRIAIFLYNLFSGKFSIPKFQKNEGKYSKEVKGYFTYPDSYTDDSKLVIYNIVNAVNNGSICLNYCEVKEIEKGMDNINITAHDHIGNKDFKINSQYVINCAGPWAGKIADNYEENKKYNLKLSKGVHIVVPSELIGIKNSVVFRSHIDKRQMFAVNRGEVTIIGTTDHFVEDPNDFSVDENDIEYIIESSQRLFTRVEKENIIFSYAGIRPLYGKSNNPGKISRGIHIEHDSRFINVFGGKLTNYRSAVRKVGKILNRMSRMGINTAGLPKIDYVRPKLGYPDIFNYERDFECAIYPDDIILRRECFPFNTLTGGKEYYQYIKGALGRDGKIIET
ncbi:glycerol-3-phosphate dehydrogenase/oxidase [Caldiplasma sukawensis]